MFRYPIKEGYLERYRNNFLDIANMANAIEQCFAMMFKCVAGSYIINKYDVEIDLTLKPNVLFFVSHGIGNCMLYYSYWDDGYYTYIDGYSNVAAFLMDKMSKDHWSVLVIAFLIRHAIELSLKLILHSRTNVRVEKQKQYSKRKSHRLYKDLWEQVKSMVEYYATEKGYDLRLYIV